MPPSQTFARTVRHPGKPDPVRIASLEGGAMHRTFTLEPGRTLRDAMHIPLDKAGIAGGTVRFENLKVAPLHFLMPALAVDDQHAAFYSAPHAIEKGTVIEFACATYGRKDGQPFVHCHAVWRGSDGQRQGGHMLMDQTIVAEACQAQAWGLHDATMATKYDPETNFTLFHPTRLEGRERAAQGKRIVLARIRPDEDLTMAIEDVCRSHGIAHAVIRGSVGSIIGADFEDGRVLEDRATEILVRSGEVRSGPDGLRAQLDIALINPEGKVCEGVLARGRNPVLICFELVIEEQ
ncbi:DUF296 domain-containing protein [Herbaspirillum sp.]|uniref:PCC domain-containing protein n=1 Tax=Herbaspirillum sp. TaxID=1890675 RepID=UPI001B1F0D44|nr:DUF296 domain-containing protein [Herbaspirillum sp.]MBO9535523.1 DUF296 domain-containing protein [Herbaspirillum sp.]